MRGRLANGCQTSCAGAVFGATLVTVTVAGVADFGSAVLAKSGVCRVLPHCNLRRAVECGFRGRIACSAVWRQ